VDSAELVTLFRKDMVDETRPFLWSDFEVYGYADDAQKMFARLTGGIPDMTSSAITQLPFDIDQTDIKLDPRILKVRSGVPRLGRGPISVINYENMTKEGVRFDGKKGPVRAVVIGADSKLAYYLPIPTIADTLPASRGPASAGDADAKMTSRRTWRSTSTTTAPVALDEVARVHEAGRGDVRQEQVGYRIREQVPRVLLRSANEKDRRKHKTRVVSTAAFPGTRISVAVATTRRRDGASCAT
jgi:hypothetical protein